MYKPDRMEIQCVSRAREGEGGTSVKFTIGVPRRFFNPDSIMGKKSKIDNSELCQQVVFYFFSVHGKLSIRL